MTATPPPSAPPPLPPPTPAPTPVPPPIAAAALDRPAGWVPRVKRGRMSVSLVWLVPIVAALVAVSMLARTWQQMGPRITVQFQSASGLVPGKTPVKYKDVVIGMVRSIELSDDRKSVIAQIALANTADEFAREDTRYWVVRPRIGTSGVSGIDTILSGAYIAADIGQSKVEQRAFVGLEQPPTVTSTLQGKTFTLQAQDLGSLDVGSPVYYRRVQVGQVAAYRLDDDGRGVKVQVFIDAPHDALVKRGSRFWNASGVDFSLGVEGVRFDAQSITTVVLGGISFATPFGADDTAAANESRFVLEKDRQTATAPPEGQSQFVQFHFAKPVRGVTLDSPVELMGLRLGRVVSVDLDQAAPARFVTVVGAQIYPQRFAKLREKLVPDHGDERERNARFLQVLADRGVRARARSASLITGQMVVALETQPAGAVGRAERGGASPPPRVATRSTTKRAAPMPAVDAAQRPLVFPTVESSSLDDLEAQAAGILAKVDRVPFESIGTRLDASLGELKATLEALRGRTLPGAQTAIDEAGKTLVDARATLDELRKTLASARSSTLAEDSQMQQNLAQTLLEVQRAARSLRTLTDLLGRRPESLLRGLPKDEVLPAPPTEATR